MTMLNTYLSSWCESSETSPDTVVDVVVDFMPDVAFIRLEHDRRWLIIHNESCTGATYAKACAAAKAKVGDAEWSELRWHSELDIAGCPGYEFWIFRQESS